MNDSDNCNYSDRILSLTNDRKSNSITNQDQSFLVNSDDSVLNLGDGIVNNNNRLPESQGRMKERTKRQKKLIENQKKEIKTLKKQVDQYERLRVEEWKLWQMKLNDKREFDKTAQKTNDNGTDEHQ